MATHATGRLPGHIARPELTSRLGAAVRAGHVLIAAPAGSGKTTAVRETLQGWEGPVAWYACQDADLDGGRFLLGLVRAVRTAVPGLVDVLADELARAGARVDPVRMASALRDDVERLLVEPLVLVLDDLERVVGHDEAGAIVAALLAGGPRLHLVLCSRRRPRRGVAKLVAAGRLAEIEAADLALSADECARLMAARTGREPSEPEVEAVLHSTGGWALGVALGGRSGRELAGFVTEEVLGPLDAAERAQVLDSAVVDDLTPGVVAALGLDAGALERLAVHGLRAGADVGRPGWHPLLRDALRERWRAERPEAERRALLARVADGLRADGREAEAVDAWLAAGREEAALDALLPVLPRVVRLAPDTVAGWLRALSPAARSRSAARLAAAQLAMTEGRHADALGPLREAEAGLRAAEEHDAADGALALRLESLYWLGRFADMEAAAEPVLGPPASLDGRPNALLAVIWAGAGRGSRGDIDGTAELAAVVAAHPDGALARTRLPLLEIYGALPGGDHDAAIGRLQQGVAALRDEDHAETRPEHFLSFIAFLLVDSGRAEAARGLSARVVAQVERSGLTAFVGTLSTVLDAWIAVHAEDWDAAEVALAALGDGDPPAWGFGLAHAARAALAAHRGDAQTVISSADRALARAASAPVAWRTPITAAVVPALALVGATGRALDVCAAALDDLAGTLAEEHSGYARARMLAQRAWITARAGDGTGAGDAARAVVVAGAAAPTLMRTEFRRVREPLRHAVVPPDTDLDPIAASLPGVEALLAFADHASPAVRAAVARQLARGGDPRAAEALGRLAGDEDAGVARTAADALERMRREPAPRDFTLLGGFALRRGGWEVDARAWGRPTVSRVVRFLLVHRGTPVDEERILEALWPEHPADKARSALRVAVSRARQVLDPEDAPESAIRFAEHAYELVLGDRDRVDATAFRVAAERALSADGPQRPALLRAAASLFGGEPLPEERYADWAQEWRTELLETHVRVLAELARAERRAGDERAVALIAGELTALDPLDEDAHRVLMTAYARTGRRALALRQYLECRRALTEALGIEPDRETSALQAAILAGEPV